jgi:hypothetical protein
MPQLTAGGNAFQIVGVSNRSIPIGPLTTRPSEVPQRLNARFGFVCVGTDENQRSLIAYWRARPFSAGNCSGRYAPMTSPSSAQLSHTVS